MAGMGALAPAALGSVTAPTSLTIGSFSTLSGSFVPWGLYQAIPVPSINAVVFTHGVEAMRYVLEGASYRLGLLAPAAGMTAASTATQATATLTLNSNPADGDYLAVGVTPPRVVYFKTTLDTSGTFVWDQVKRGANTAATIANLEDLVNGTGSQGVEYYKVGSGAFADAADATVTGTTSTTATFTARTPGADGNSYIASLAATFTDPASTFGTGNQFSGGATGTGTDPDSGDYQYALAYFRSADRAVSALSDPPVGAGQNTNCNVSLAAFPTLPTRDGGDYYRWFRTLVGGTVFWKGDDTSSTSDTDDLSDATISDEAFRYKYDATLHRPRVAGRPVVGRYGVLWRGRLWTMGAIKAAQYSSGTASVTNGSASVTLSSTCRLKDWHIGATFRVASHNLDYLVVDVDYSTPSAPVATLNRAYQGGTSGSASYTLTDERDQFLPAYTEPNLLNNWPAANSVSGVSSRSTAGITGAVEVWDSLVVFTKTSVWRIRGDTGAFAVESVGDGMGCYGGHAVQVADGGTIYWLGPDGVFAWDGAGQPTPLSRPTGDPDGAIQSTLDRINGDEAEMIVSNYNQSTGRVRWWVPLDGETLNNHCLRLDVKSRSFALHTASAVTAAATVPGPAGTQVTLVGDAYGDVFQMDAGWSDGAYGFEPRQALSSYTASTRTLSFSGTPLPTSGDGLKGVPGVVVNATTGAYQRFTVATNTSSAAVVTAQFATAPSANDYVIFGGIPLDIQTARFDYEQPELPKWLEAATLAHEVESGATEVWCGAASDNDDPACFAPSGSTVDYAAATTTDGEKHYWLYTARGRTLVLRLLAFGRGYQLRLRGIVLSVRTPAMAEVEG